jgi:hypothetical protein
VTPAKNYINALYQLACKTSKNPLNPENPDEFMLYDTVATEMRTIPDFPHWVHFVMIVVKNPGSGKGNKGMKALIDLAKKHRVVLFGKVEPKDKNISTARLGKWYQKYGGVIFDSNMCCRPIKKTDLDDIKKLSSDTYNKIKYTLNDYDLQQYKKRKRIFSIILLLGIILYLSRNNF